MLKCLIFLTFEYVYLNVTVTVCLKETVEIITMDTFLNTYIHYNVHGG